MQRKRSRAFTLTELLLVLMIIAVVMALVVPALSFTKRSARSVQSMSNLKQIGTATGSFTSVNDDKLYTFDWKAGRRSPRGPYGNGLDPIPGETRLNAAVRQAAYMVRRTTNVSNFDIKDAPNWLPHTNYSHLMLAPFFSERLPEEVLTAPSDRLRSKLIREIRGTSLSSKQSAIDTITEEVGDGYTGMMQMLPDTRLLLLSSSYQVGAAHYDQAQSRPARTGRTRSVRSKRISPSSRSSFFLVPDGNWDGNSAWLGGTRMYEVSFPTLKIAAFDYLSRDRTKKQRIFAYEDAIVPLLTYDGSVREKKTLNTNYGWFPRTSQAGVNVDYWAEPINGGVLPGSDGLDKNRASLRIRYDFTFSGLKGIDFGGPRINIDSDSRN